MEELYQKLRVDWYAGCRDREQALHLLFLLWWHWVEPDFLTGLIYDPTATELWHEIFAYFGGEASPDPEFLFVGGIMAKVTPFAFGDENVWDAVAETMMARSRELEPAGISPEVFERRGDYGEYFAHQSRVHSGDY
jgi:hypothetical protein